MEYRYFKYNSSNIIDAIKETKNIIIPIGAIEAHSEHLPLDTDNQLVEYYSNELAKSTNSLVMPVINYGAVWSLSEAPGSIDIGNAALVRMLKKIIVSLEKNGAKMVTLASAHFGNIDACKQAARELYRKHDIKVIYLTYPDIKNNLYMFDVVNTHSLYLHACEVETSMMMYVNNKDVDHMKLSKGIIDVPLETSYTPTKWTEFTNNYIIGDARKSTYEKGEKIFNIIIKNASKIISEEKEKLS